MPRTAEKTDRDARLVAMHERGATVAALADNFDVTPRHVRRILARHAPQREAPPAIDDLAPIDVATLDPSTELGSLLALFRWSESELRQLATTTRQDAVRVAALRSLAAIARDRFRLTGDRILAFRAAGEVEAFGRVAVEVLVDEAKRLGMDLDDFAARIDDDIRGKAAGVLARAGVDFEGFAPEPEPVG